VKDHFMPRLSSNLLKNEWTAEQAKTSKLEVSLAVAARFARRHAIAAIYRAGSGDVGAALSSAELLACLYGAELNLWPSTISDPDRDRFVLSNGNAAPTLYAVASHYGFCDADEALNFCKFGSRFQMYPRGESLAFVESSAGSPGQGFSTALGMAMGLKQQRRPARVYALLGDSEVQAGQVWEAAMCAAHHRLDNFCAIVELHRRPGENDASSVLRLEPMAAKWRAFDWAVAEVDGHDIPALLSAFRRAGSATQNRPALIVAHTVRGKDVPALQDAPSSHAPLTMKLAAESLAALGMSHKEITELIDVG
jgi:transketolase